MLFEVFFFIDDRHRHTHTWHVLIWVIQRHVITLWFFNLEFIHFRFIYSEEELHECIPSVSGDKRNKITKNPHLDHLCLSSSVRIINLNTKSIYFCIKIKIKSNIKQYNERNLNRKTTHTQSSESKAGCQEMNSFCLFACFVDDVQNFSTWIIK